MADPAYDRVLAGIVRKEIADTEPDVHPEELRYCGNPRCVYCTVPESERLAETSAAQLRASIAERLRAA